MIDLEKRIHTYSEKYRDPAIEKTEVALSLWIEKRLYAHWEEPISSGGDVYTNGGFQASES